MCPIERMSGVVVVGARCKCCIEDEPLGDNVLLLVEYCRTCTAGAAARALSLFSARRYSFRLAVST